MIALSALAVGVAIAGAIAALRGGADSRRARFYLVATFAIVAGVAGIPLVVAFARPLYVFYMPAALPMLMTLPAAIHRYARARTGDAKGPRADARDALLPAAGLILTLGYWSLPASARDAMFVDGELPPGAAANTLASLTLVLIFLWSIASFAYLVATMRALHAHRERLKSLYSNTEKFELRWIDGLLALLAALWAAAAASLLSDNFGPGLPFPGEIVFALAGAALLFLIAFALAPAPSANDQAGADAPTDSPEQSSDGQSPEKYARSALTPERAGQIAERIEAAMRRDQLHLDANLSLRKLSRHVGAPQNIVSQTLNERLGATFFDYVAHWRIETAKPMIEAGDASVLAIALEVGFNSRSTFYKAFKRETGLTPKAYRDSRRGGP